MVNQVTGTNALGSATAVDGSNKSLARLGEDFDKFLLLLTTQLKNQDPLDPVDTAEFTNQLVQFASVEQLIQQNKHFEALLANQQIDLAGTAANFIGKTVESPGSLSTLQNGQALWSYELNDAAAAVFLTLVDAESGEVVRTIPGTTSPGMHRVVWDGTTEDGSVLDDGDYQLRVQSVDLDGEAMLATVRGFGKVTNVEMVNGKPQLVVFGRAIDMTDVTSIGN